MWSVISLEEMKQKPQCATTTLLIKMAQRVWGGEPDQNAGIFGYLYYSGKDDSYI